MEIDIAVHRSDAHGDIITLTKPLACHFAENEFTVPAGFGCDGVSVPRLLWRLVSPRLHPTTLRAGIAHDYLYRRQPPEWTRRRADRLFWCYMREDGHGFVSSALGYVGVRLFGWIAWRRNRRRAGR